VAWLWVGCLLFSLVGVLGFVLGSLAARAGFRSWLRCLLFGRGRVAW
jgi:hypothetical protein